MTNKIKIDIIYNGDCLKLLKKMEPKSVDLIVTSPPYVDSRKDTYGGVSFKKMIQHVFLLPINVLDYIKVLIR